MNTCWNFLLLKIVRTLWRWSRNEFSKNNVHQCNCSTSSSSFFGDEWAFLLFPHNWTIETSFSWLFDDILYWWREREKEKSVNDYPPFFIYLTHIHEHLLDSATPFSLSLSLPPRLSSGWINTADVSSHFNPHQHVDSNSLNCCHS